MYVVRWYHPARAPVALGRTARSWNRERAAGMEEQLRSYLIGVYPAEAPGLRRLSGAGLVERFGALDYYYTCSPSMLLSLVPSNGGCEPISSRYATSSAAPALPYLPPGAFYRAVAGTATQPLSAFMYSSWSRHPTPVEVHAEPLLPQTGLARFQSSFGARVGPTPSWTNPNALVRYPLYPSGLDLAALRPERGGAAPKRHARPPRAAASSQSAGVGFDLGSHPKVARLLRLRDGDLMEVEQWGGPLYSSPECPPICGMWGNIYTGTGVFLRTARPRVTCAGACVRRPCTPRRAAAWHASWRSGAILPRPTTHPRAPVLLRRRSRSSRSTRCSRSCR